MSEAVFRSEGDFRLGIVGDLHTHWDDVDLMQFSQTDYDLLYFTGDLGGGTPDSTLRVARSMARLQQPTLVMPGNNDTGDINELSAELVHQNGLNQLMAIAQAGEDDTQAISLCGYSCHYIETAGETYGLIAARPHSLGGPELSFPDYMADTYGIGSLEDSTRRLKSLVDDCVSEQLIFLAHNGPVGLGDQPHDMWGCDFKENGGDWGDPDLTVAIDHAREMGRNVRAVVAGHMHLQTRQGKERPWYLERSGTMYINAALVPRIYSGEDDVYRHHVVLNLSGNEIAVEKVLVPQYG